MPESSPPKQICVVRLSAIGDTCHALAVVRAIQDSWPESKLTWIIGKTEAGLLADIPDIEFIIFDKRKGRKALKETKAKLKDRHFDVVLCMHASMRANRLYRCIRSPVRLGFDFARARDFQWLFTNQRIEAHEKEHVLDGMMRFATHIGVSQKALRWDIPLTDEHREFAARHTHGDNPVLLISPCSSQRSRNFRNWSAENYAAVADHAAINHRCRIILTGGPSDLEKNYGMQIRQAAKTETTDLIGRTDLKQLLALIATSDIVLCPDSGPAHMATAVGTPVIGLYATSNPARSGPYLSRELTVNAYEKALMVYLGKTLDQVRWGRRVRDPGAMALIEVKDVTNRIDSFFAR